MIFVIQTIGDVSGLDIVEALSRAGISHVILSKQNDDAAEQSVQADLGWTCGKCGTSANVGYRCSWCEEKRPSR